jgi:hypothetical protein
LQELTSVTYNVSVYSPALGDIMLFLPFQNVPGMDDAAVLALVQTLREFEWPSMLSPVTVSVNKSLDNATITQCNASTNPPAFN